MGRFDEDIYVNGNFQAKVLIPSAGSITNAAIAAAAGIVASKLQHEHRHVYSQPNTTATAETRIVHVCQGATGTIKAFVAGSIVAALLGATVTVDLKKNGTTVLSAVITLDSGNTAYIVEAGTITVPGLVVGDVLTIVTTATAGGGTIPTGLFVALTVTEDYTA